MARFLLGVLLVCVAMAGYTLTRPEAALLDGTRPVFWLLGMLVALPLGSAWAVAEAVDRWAPRMAFDRRARGAWQGGGLVLAGLGAAVLAYIVATLMLAVVGWLPDAAVMILSTVCSTAIVLLVCFGGKRAGACVRCLYRLEASQNRCPECGGIGTRA